MKRFLSLGLAVILMLSISISAFAAENENIDAVLDRRIKVTYNGELQTFTDANGKIVYPIVYEGTTYLPVRAASALVKLPVEWDGANYTVVLGGDKAPYEAAAPVGTPLTESENIKTVLDKNIKVTFNGELQTFTDVNGKVVYPIVHEGTTYLPVRAVSNLVNLPVEWDGANYTVVLGEKAEQPVTPPVAEPSKLARGSWNNHIYTNEFANIKYTANDDTLVYSEEYIEENIGNSTDEVLYDFLVADTVNQAVISISYQDMAKIIAENGVAPEDITADLFAESYAYSVEESGKGSAIGVVDVKLGDDDYVVVMVEHAENLEYTYFRVFDNRYMTTVIIVANYDTDIEAAIACFN